MSPDGHTLLSVGDSSKVYLHRVTGGRRLTFSPITTLTLPPPVYYPPNYSSTSPVASFSTAFSSDGSKFAVASQEGSVVVYDVRSSKPLKIFNTDKTRGWDGKDGVTNGSASGWLSDDPWDWSRGSSRAPGWGVRSVKFGGGGGYGQPGKEVMVFTEVRAKSDPNVNLPDLSHPSSTRRWCTSSMHRPSIQSKLFACHQHQKNLVAHHHFAPTCPQHKSPIALSSPVPDHTTASHHPSSSLCKTHSESRHPIPHLRHRHKHTQHVGVHGDFAP